MIKLLPSLSTLITGTKVLLVALLVIGYIWQMTMRQQIEQQYMTLRQQFSNAQTQLQQVHVQQQQLLALINDNDRQKETAQLQSIQRQEAIKQTLYNNDCARQRVPVATLQLHQHTINNRTTSQGP